MANNGINNSEERFSTVATRGGGDSGDSGNSGNRVHELASMMHSFNKFVQHEPQLQQVILPLRDGLTIIRFNATATAVTE